VARAPSEEPEGIVYEPELLPVGYVFAGEARRSWEHSIPKTKERRYSITFRTLRTRG
jgi:DNA oxidative demethylase